MRLFLLLSLLLASAAAAGPAPAVRASASPSPAPISPDALFSRRALRRAKLLLQMRLMEFHEERLECIRAALRRQLPEALWADVPAPPRGSGVPAAVEDCEELLKF